MASKTGTNFWFGLHRHDQRFLRHLEEFAVERAGDRHRPFGQVGDLVEQIGGQARRAAGFASDAADFVDDALAALGRIGKHLGRAQCIEPGVGIGDMHRAGMMEAVAARLASRLSGRTGWPSIDLGAMQHDQPVHRAYEANSRDRPSASAWESAGP